MRIVHCWFGVSRVRLALRALVIAACSICVAPTLGVAQRAWTAYRPEPDRPIVRVSRHELRIVFPHDTARQWGWSAAPPEPPNAPRYSWRMEVDAIQGPRDIRFDVSSSIPFPSTFRSLRDLLGSGHGRICSYGMMTTCGETRMTGAAEHDHTVLTLRDSALISWVFALRPRFVRLTNDRPETSFVWDSVRIDYVAPNVRPLDSATRADALRARRRESLARFSVQRFIMGGRGFPNHIWLIVGDSLPLRLVETQRLEDQRISGQRDLTDSGWVVLDPRVAQLFKPSPETGATRELQGEQGHAAVVDYGPPRMYIKALRPGSTLIRVRGVHGFLDAALESEPAPGVIASELLVTRKPRRIEITPRADTLRVGQHLRARVRVYDAAGTSTDRVPVELVCTACIGSYYDGVHPNHLWSSEPGRMTIVARLDGLADTLSLVVVDSGTTSKKR